ncbi:MAG: MFS transporter, partial [Actinomycetota bacterium]
MRRVLRAPGFARLLAAQGVTGLGDWVGTVAFIAAARELTGSPLAVGAVLVIRLVPPIFAAPVGGALADRFDRRTVMALSSAGQAALIAAVPFVGITGLYVLAFAQESLALVFFPARDATVPDLVAREDLPTANGLIMASSFASIPFAFALFSGLRLVATHTPDWVPIAGVLREHPLAAPFFFDAATFATCGLLVLGLPASRSPQREDEGALLRGSLDGFRLARGNPVLRALGLGVAVAMFGGGVLFAVGISFVHGSLGAGDV